MTFLEGLKMKLNLAKEDIAEFEARDESVPLELMTRTTVLADLILEEMDFIIHQADQKLKFLKMEAIQ